ncbi:nucleotide-binding universal stress UspA family protein [Salirhabdus euzebyi]|uniref:Nucleotide-binding universal stress UspA family protein n=1 Tax=Salirhabdus euzebyi TaxID=394506 RepID=A0A841PS90_9BACI|nr:universal stress protein [Salirhabdus euzebyi]MBB6451807.1 nucleotide-binding universal stress UspA family protein [Salirhabdus euzebyi]
MKKLLVAIDGSEHSKKAFQLALSMTKGQNVELVLLNVQPTYHSPNVKRFVNLQQIREYQEELSQEAFDIILSDANLADDVHLSKKVRLGDPGTEICKEAKEINATLIIMGNRGLGPIKRAVLGSVSYSVLHNATCPVTIVP